MEHKLSLVFKNFGLLLPYFFAGAGLCLLARVLYYAIGKKSRSRFDPVREAALITFAGYLAALFVALFHGGVDNGQINWVPFSEISEYFALIGANTGTFIVYLFGNIFSFTPLAFFLPLISSKIKPRQGILICFGFSILTEAIQHFLGRFSDIDDVILNTFGATLGALLFLLLQKLAPDFTERARGKANATRREEDSAP